jgi:hypothetical protein
MNNLTEDIDYLVVTNKVLENRLYHYIVHLSKMTFLINKNNDYYYFFK